MENSKPPVGMVFFSFEPLVFWIFPEFFASKIGHHGDFSPMGGRLDGLFWGAGGLWFWSEQQAVSFLRLDEGIFFPFFLTHEGMFSWGLGVFRGLSSRDGSCHCLDRP